MCDNRKCSQWLCNLHQTLYSAPHIMCQFLVKCLTNAVNKIKSEQNFSFPFVYLIYSTIHSQLTSVDVQLSLLVSSATMK